MQLASCDVQLQVAMYLCLDLIMKVTCDVRASHFDLGLLCSTLFIAKWLEIANLLSFLTFLKKSVVPPDPASLK